MSKAITVVYVVASSMRLIVALLLGFDLSSYPTIAAQFHEAESARKTANSAMRRQKVTVYNQQE